MFNSAFLIINLLDLPTRAGTMEAIWTKEKGYLGTRNKGTCLVQHGSMFSKAPKPRRDAFAQISSQHRRESPGAETDQPQGISCKWIVASVAFSPNERRVHVGKLKKKKKKKMRRVQKVQTSRRSPHTLLHAPPLTATGNRIVGAQKPRMRQTTVVIVCNWHRSGSRLGSGVDTTAAASSADHHRPSRSASAALVRPCVAFAAQTPHLASRSGS